VSEHNRDIIRRYFGEVVNAGHLEVVDELFSEDAVFLTPLGRFEGRDGIRQLVTGFRGGFSDLNVEVEEILGEGDRLAVRVTTTGTNDGELLGNPPTGNEVRLPFVHFVSFQDGKYRGDQVIYDRLALMEQLGLVPQLARGA
jgi:predicted ester cyclase